MFLQILKIIFIISKSNFLLFQNLISNTEHIFNLFNKLSFILEITILNILH